MCSHTFRVPWGMAGVYAMPSQSLVVFMKEPTAMLVMVFWVFLCVLFVLCVLCLLFQ